MKYHTIIFAALTALITGLEHEWLGCCADTGTRALRYGPHAYGYTVDTCSDACSSYRYFALQNNGWCCCDYDYDHATMYGEATNCPTTQLGAGWANDLFEHPAEPYSYVGCYGDTGTRALPDGPHEYGFTPETCSNACYGYSYFALQNGGWCCCGNDWAYASQYGEQTGCPTSQLGAGWLNDIFQHYELTNCLGTACDDSDACTDDHCDPFTGSCTNAAISCDDGDPCTVDSCDVINGCSNDPIDCGDGNLCNGEEACYEGGCVDGMTFECPVDFICDEEAAGCIRDCSILAIDGYLTTCSAEFASNELELAQLSEYSEEALTRVDALEGPLATASADIATLTTAVAEAFVLIGENPFEEEVPLYPLLEDVISRLSAVETELATVSAHLFGLGPHPPEEEDAEPTIPLDNWWFQCVVVVNMALLMMICVGFWCYKNKTQRKYTIVQQYSSADDENIKLNQ